MSNAELVTQLRSVFPVADHQAREGGYGKWFIYIKRDAIIDRLDQVAPMTWESRTVEIKRHEHTVTVTMEMAINGISRSYNGSAEDKPIYKDKKTKEIIGWNSENTEKAASTDAFKRVASMFGIGLYLQKSPRIKANNENDALAQFKGWYHSTFKADSPVENGKQPSKPKRNPSKKDGKASPKIDVTQEQEDDISWHPGFMEWAKKTMGDEWSKPNMLAALTNSLDLVTCHEMADYPGDKMRAMLAIGCWMIGYDDELVADMVADYFQSTRDKSPEVFAEYLEIACLNNQRYSKARPAPEGQEAEADVMF